MLSPIDEIKSRIDIVDLVGGYIKLTRRGSNYRALCPFHSEKTPSFNVSPTRQIWHCFGCSRGGDHFKFVMEIEGLEFPEALRLLAKKAGVELKREDPRIQSERNRLYDLLEDAAAYFQKNLENVSAVRAYLKKRGLADATVADFRIGFSFDAWDGALQYLMKKGHKEQEIERAGLAVASENGRRYDRFRSRIIFPVSDGSGRIVGFGGRIFELAGVATGGGRPPSAKAAEGQAKYINTPQTLVYDKSRVLYAFDKAKEAVRKKNACVIVEGYMDAVMSHQAGAANTVAVSGTALTPEQLRMIRRLSDTLISSFDSDSAGEAATKRSLDLAAAYGFERKVAVLPAGIKDPADMVLADAAGWMSAVEHAVPIVAFYVTRAFAKHNSETAEGVKAISQEVLPEIAHLANEVERAHWVGKIARALAVSEEAVWRELANVKTEGADIDAFRPEEHEAILAKSKKEQLEELSLGALALFGHLAKSYAGRSDELFSRPSHRDIFNAIAAGAAPSLPEALRGELNHLAFRAETFLDPVDQKEEAACTLLKTLHTECLKEKCSAITRKIIDAERAGSDGAVAALAEEYKRVVSELQAVTKGGI